MLMRLVPNRHRGAASQLGEVRGPQKNLLAKDVMLSDEGYEIAKTDSYLQLHTVVLDKSWRIGMAFCIHINVAGMPHRLRDWEREATQNSRFVKPSYLTDRFDWVGLMGVYYTRFPSRAEAETAAKALRVEQPYCVYSIRPI